MGPMGLEGWGEDAAWEIPWQYRPGWGVCSLSPLNSGVFRSLLSQNAPVPRREKAAGVGTMGTAEAWLGGWVRLSRRHLHKTQNQVP